MEHLTAQHSEEFWTLAVWHPYPGGVYLPDYVCLEPTVIQDKVHVASDGQLTAR